jgi:hypothetical protein
MVSVCVDKNWVLPGRFFRSLLVPCGASEGKGAKMSDSFASIVFEKKKKALDISLEPAPYLPHF